MKQYFNVEFLGKVSYLKDIGKKGTMVVGQLSVKESKKPYLNIGLKAFEDVAEKLIACDDHTFIEGYGKMENNKNNNKIYTNVIVEGFEIVEEDTETPNPRRDKVKKFVEKATEKKPPLELPPDDDFPF